MHVREAICEVFVSPGWLDSGTHVHVSLRSACDLRCLGYHDAYMVLQSPVWCALRRLHACLIPVWSPVRPMQHAHECFVAALGS